jgi:type IV secretory pathway VirB4 component
MTERKMTEMMEQAQEAINQWALSVVQRLEREIPEVLDDLLSKNKIETDNSEDIITPTKKTAKDIVKDIFADIRRQQ